MVWAPLRRFLALAILASKCWIGLLQLPCQLDSAQVAIASAARASRCGAGEYRPPRRAVMGWFAHVLR